MVKAEKPVKVYKMVCVKDENTWTGPFVRKDSFPFGEETQARGEDLVYKIGGSMLLYEVGSGYFHSMGSLKKCVRYVRMNLDEHYGRFYGGSHRIVGCTIPAGTCCYTDMKGGYASKSIVVRRPSAAMDAAVNALFAWYWVTDEISLAFRRVYNIYKHKKTKRWQKRNFCSRNR